MNEQTVTKAVVQDDFCPVDYLSEKERDIVWAIINILEASIVDQDLKENLIGGIFCDIEDWGEKGRDGGTH